MISLDEIERQQWMKDNKYNIEDLVNKYHHKHIWYLAGTIRHPRMGWPVDFYLCIDIHWSVDLKCYAVAIGEGVSGDSKAGTVYKDFAEMYYHLGAP